MSGHTPGPWEVVGGGYPGVLHVKGPPLPITIVTSALDIDFAGSLEREANARLIAAAPELLEALLGMIVSYELEASPLNPALLKARAVLAKATGGAE